MVRNFEKFQHYKDRSPPWIKLYNELLENYEFGKLPDDLKGQLILIWLLASRLDNKIPFDAKWVSQKINASSLVDLNQLFELGWIEPFEPKNSKGKIEDWPSRYIPETLRSVVFERDRNRCVECQSTENLELDHKVPVSKGGQSIEENLQVLCRSCNRRKRVKFCSVSVERVATQIRSLETEGETETDIRANALDGFDHFWKTYPKKKSKGQAEKAWKKLRAGEQLQERILKALERAKKSESWLKNDGKFIPHPATWLNAKGWEDEEPSNVVPLMEGIL